MQVRTLPKAPVLRAGTVDPDAALVAAAREDPQAFLALYDRHFERVLGYVRLRIRDGSTWPTPTRRNATASPRQ